VQRKLLQMTFAFAGLVRVGLGVAQRNALT
jgi:hypothetical protein